jgi:hypothetical protein
MYKETTSTSHRITGTNCFRSAVTNFRSKDLNFATLSHPIPFKSLSFKGIAIL